MAHAKKPEVGDKVIYNGPNFEKIEATVSAVKEPFDWNILIDVDYKGLKYYGSGFFPYNTNEFHTDGTWNYA